MPFKFYTKNLNERLYIRLIRDFIYDMFDGADEDFHNFMAWDWLIFPSTEAHKDPHFNGRDGVGGVSGMGETKLYLEDKRTDLIHDIFLRTLRANMIVTTHEGCHGILIYKGMTHKVPLRNDELSGRHKAGTILNFSTAEVHDRHAEGRLKSKTVWFWDWETFKAYRVNVQYVDIDDLV